MKLVKPLLAARGNRATAVFAVLVCFGYWFFAAAAADFSSRPEPNRVRVGAAQPRSRLIDHRITEPKEVLDRVDQTLASFEEIIRRAGNAKCDALVFPEDTLGLGHWEAARKPVLASVLREAVGRMLHRLGAAASAHQMYLILCNDTADEEGAIRNTAFFLGRDGRVRGRYDKVNMPIHELDRKRGEGFPVFDTPDLGGVGMLICYDMVFPEAARCLALGGADIIFHPTLGGAAIGDHDISRAAFRTRAVENFVYLAVAQRGQGSMIVSPQGRILAETEEPDGIAIADIDPRGGREGGDAMNRQADMRARIFRERSPSAFGMLTDPNPPVLAKAPERISIAEAVDIASRTLTVGQERFKEAEELFRAGHTNRAIAAFETLRREFRATWIDRVSGERLAQLGTVRARSAEASPPAPPASGIASNYPKDRGIHRDPRVLFAEDFEEGGLGDVERRWGQASNQGGTVLAFSRDTPSGSAGERSLQVTATLGENTGGHLYTRLPHGVDKIFARFYVKFPAEPGYIHHFVTLGGYNPPTPWPQGGAGERPRGNDRFTAGIEPFGFEGRFPPPGAWNFYAYWPEMKESAGGKYWGNSIRPIQPARVPVNRWQCVEIMLECNSAPEKADGKLALWLDGQPAAAAGPGAPRGPWTGLGFQLLEQGGEPFEGFRWRTDPELKINFFWLLHYVTENALRRNGVSEPAPVNRVWFDHIVLGTEYIGPLDLGS